MLGKQKAYVKILEQLKNLHEKSKREIKSTPFETKTQNDQHQAYWEGSLAAYSDAIALIETPEFIIEGGKMENEPRAEKTKFDQWGILELMGHRRLAGKISEATIGGGSFIKIDVPAGELTEAFSQYYSPGSIYCLTPTTEQIARAVAKNCQPDIVYEFNLRALTQPKERQCRVCLTKETNLQPGNFMVEDDLCHQCQQHPDEEEAGHEEEL